MLITIKSLTWLVHGAESTDHQLSIALIDLALETVHLREEEFEMNKWNVSVKYVNTHLNYSVMLMYSATPPTQTPKGNKKSVEVKCGLCPVNNYFKESCFFLSCTINSHFHTFRLFYKSFFTSLVYLSYMYFIFMNVITFSYDIIINQHFFLKFELLQWIWGMGKSN